MTWTRSPLDLSTARFGAADKAKLQRQLNDMPTPIQDMLMEVLPEATESRYILYSVARIDQCAFNQERLAAWARILRTTTRKRRNSHGEYPKPWRQRHSGPAEPHTMNPRIQEVADFLMALGPIPCHSDGLAHFSGPLPPHFASIETLALQDRPAEFAAAIQEFLADYLTFRVQKERAGHERDPRFRHVEHMPSFSERRANGIRRAAHHFYSDLYGLEVGKSYANWAIRGTTAVQGGKRLMSRSQVDDSLACFTKGMRDCLEVISVGLNPPVACDLVPATVAFSHDGIPLVQIGEGWVGLPMDHGVLSDLKIRHLEAGRTDELFRNARDKRITPVKISQAFSSRRAKGGGANRVANHGAGQMLVDGVNEYLVARIRGSSQRWSMGMKRDALRAAAKDAHFFRSPAQTRLQLGTELQQCRQCTLIEPRRAIRGNRCSNCKSTAVQPMEPGRAAVAKVAQLEREYEAAMNRPLAADSRRLLELLASEARR